jgi:hypothetical protein
LRDAAPEAFRIFDVLQELDTRPLPSHSPRGAVREKYQKLMTVMAAGDPRRRFEVCSAHLVAGAADIELNSFNWRRS